MGKQGDAQWLGIKLKRMMTGTLSPPSRTTCAYNAHLSCFSSSFLPRAMQNHLNTLHVRHEVRRTWARWCSWMVRNGGRTRNSPARQGRFPPRRWQSRARHPKRLHIRCRQVHDQRAAHHVVSAGSHTVAALGTVTMVRTGGKERTKRRAIKMSHAPGVLDGVGRGTR